MTKPKIPAMNSILSFMHCGKCMQEFKDGKGGNVSPRDYARFEAGWTKQGLQIRCVRHDLNIIHLDFEGHKHPACTAGTDDE